VEQGGPALIDCLPLAWLVGCDLPHRRRGAALAAGVLPVQMTFEGANEDVLSGVTALFVTAARAQ
jgi:hypothetical protein